MMNEFGSSEDHQPVTWYRGFPVYAAHLIVLGFIASMLVTTLMNLFNVGGMLLWLPFSSALVLKGEVWRVVTYGLLNPPSLQFVIDMVMIAFFGREVERSFGRRAFLSLYGCLYFLSPLIFTVIGTWLPTELRGETGAFALFVAVATLHPEMPMLFNLLAKWVAVILVSIYALMDLSSHNWTGLITLVATTGFAFAFVRHQQGRFTLPTISLGKPKTKLRVLPDLPAKKVEVAAVKTVDSMAEMDALLDKIARTGMASLTSKERARLQAARTELMKKDAGSR